MRGRAYGGGEKTGVWYHGSQRRNFFLKQQKGNHGRKMLLQKRVRGLTLDCVRFRSLLNLSAINKNMIWHCDKGNRGQEQHSIRGIIEAN